MTIDRSQMAEFLRRRREALQPEDVGMPRGQRRRTRGLRREEVAVLCHMSTDYYTRLEQERGPQPSEQMIASIAQGLHLTVPERDHLFRLAGHQPPARGPSSEHVSPGMLRIFDRLADTPAEIVTELGETLRQTPPKVALVGDWTRYTRSRAQQRLPLVHRPRQPGHLRARGPRVPLPHVRRRPPRDRRRARTWLASRRAGRPAARAERGVPHPVGRPRDRPRARRGQALPAPRGRPCSTSTARSCSTPTSRTDCWCTPPTPAPRATRSSRCSPSSAPSTCPRPDPLRTRPGPAAQPVDEPERPRQRRTRQVRGLIPALGRIQPRVSMTRDRRAHDAGDLEPLVRAVGDG